MSLLGLRQKENQSFDKAISYKTKKKIKNRETTIRRRIKAIETEIDKARAIIQNKENRDNYMVLQSKVEEIEKLENEYLDLIEENESLIKQK